MQWIPLTELKALDVIAENSFTKTQVIFKHSTRCSISTMAEGRLKRGSDIENADCYFLDLLEHRDISNAIADKFNVHHESPQILVIKNGDCILEQSHSAINHQELIEVA